MGFDIIGDVHGQHLKLEALLKHLGYRRTQGAWRHPDRQAVFVGDLIDRGPGQLATLNMARDMVEGGSAKIVMGNHEFNSLAYFTPDPENPGGFLRERSKKNSLQHESFLREVGEDSHLHKEWMDWFMDIPLWLEMEDFRVVHACWHEPSMKYLKGMVGEGNTMTQELLVAASRKNSKEYGAVETICKGIEVDLPDGFMFVDKQGTKRKRTRIKWWDESSTTYRNLAMVGQMAEILPDTDIVDKNRVLYDQKKSVFFGHYWMTGKPSILGDKICCVDYSAAIGDEPLVCYRFDGEDKLSNDKLISVGPGIESIQRVAPRLRVA